MLNSSLVTLKASFQDHLLALSTFSQTESVLHSSEMERITAFERKTYLESLWRIEEHRLSMAKKIFLPHSVSPLKTHTETFCWKMRESGKYLNELLFILEYAAIPWISPKELDGIARAFFFKYESVGIRPAFLGFEGYQNIISVSRNDGIYHLPINDTPLKDGDIVTIDAGVDLFWANTDAAISKVIWIGTDRDNNLVTSLKKWLLACLPLLNPGNTLYDQSVFIHDWAVSEWYHVIRDCNGHGVGEFLHEEPDIVHWPAQYLKNLELCPGNIFTLEPIFTHRSNLSVTHGQDSSGFTEFGDFWAYREYTILITDTGAECIAWLI